MTHHPDCDTLDINPEGIKKPCNCGLEMSDSRWNMLMNSGPTPPLTEREIAHGWHFCNDWDLLLVGPGMEEQKCCTCENIPLTHPSS